MSLIAKALGPHVENCPSTPWRWPAGRDAASCWQDWAKEVAAWMAAQGADPRDALVILPVGAVLAQARQAWAEAVGGWVPRIDTIAAVASGLAWSWQPSARAGQGELPLLTLDVVVDRLQAGRKLGGEAWGRQWAQRDRRGFEFALDQVVAAAHTWLKRLQALPPGARAAYVDSAREHVAGPVGTQGAAQGPGGRERLLLAWALEWAAATAEPGLAVDALYGLRPSAWVGVTAGEAVAPGTEASLMLAVMAHLAEQGVAVRRVCALPDPHGGSARPPVRVACGDAEDEAQQAAAQVIRLVNEARLLDARDREARQAVALIALDRSLIRRVRAMLEGAGLQIADETGWRLSTTRAAAVLTRLLQAAQPRASSDDVLDWLISAWLAGPQGDEALTQATGQLEGWCRRHGMLGAWSLLPEGGSAAPQRVPQGRDAMPQQACTLLQWAWQVVAPLQALWQGGRPTLHDWLTALRDSLVLAGSHERLAADPAGALALASLRLDPALEAPELGQAWQGLSSQTRLDGPTFQRWVGAVLEDTTFRPPAPDQPADVVITPLARAVLRPFHAMVIPGADERQLGALGQQSGWLSTRLCEAMALPTPAQLRAAQWDAFALLMNRPGVVCLHRQAQGSEPLEPSAWLERWAALVGVPLAHVADARQCVLVSPEPVSPPLPVLTGHDWALPAQVTATAYEALRQCPYRFFAGSVLGLRSQDELEEGLDRSEFGIWLHEVLRRFHANRQQQLALSTEAEDVAAWLDSAAQVVREKGLDRDGLRPFFLPYQADLDKLAQAYVDWLRAHEAQGWAFQGAELHAEREWPIDAHATLRLHGQLDRVDARHVDGARQQLVIDYKTGQLDGLKARVGKPMEDTQLAFYAALSDPRWPVSAAYLHLDARGVTQVDHADVQEAAQALLDGLGHDWARMRAGAPLPALGEGGACTFCQARGLCRKDHWTTGEAAS